MVSIKIYFRPQPCNQKGKKRSDSWHGGERHGPLFNAPTFAGYVCDSERRAHLAISSPDPAFNQSLLSAEFCCQSSYLTLLISLTSWSRGACCELILPPTCAYLTPS